MIKTVLFDFDGTLMNTREKIFKSWQYLFRVVKGIEVTEKDIETTFGEPMMTSIERLLPDVDTEEALKIYRDFQNKNYPNMILFDGMYDLVMKLKNNGYRLAVVTSRGGASTIKGLKDTGLDGVFDVLITADRCTKHKPDPQPVNMAIDELSADRATTVMIGDTEFDLKSGKSAGVKTILVGWTKDVKLENISEQWRPTAVGNTPADIYDLIRNM